MAWITDSLRSAIASVSPFGGARGQQPIADRIFSPQLAVAAYLSSGMLRKCIDIPAQDRVREWREWQADSEEVTKLEAEEKRLGLMRKVREAEVMRGIGGGALILALPGQPSEEARPGPIAAINVVSRWQLTLVDLIEDMTSPQYGQPRMFRMNAGSKVQQDIHPSRVVVFRGDPIPMGLSMTREDAFWGSSRLERLVGEVQKADNAAQWFSELVKKAKLLRIGISNLSDMAATEAGAAKLAARVAMIATGESVLNATVFDAGDGKDGSGEKITDYQVTWTGIPAMMDAFDQRVAAVADIPFTRLMGRSPAGMNATGEHDAANWAAAVAAGQELELRPCMEQIDPFLFASAKVDQADIWWKFVSIHKPSAKEDADRFKTTADAIKLIADVNALPERAFNAGVQSVIEANGWMPGAIPELAKLGDDERFGAMPDDDDTDPSGIQAEGGDLTSQAATGGDGSAPVRRAANDKREVGERPGLPFDDAKRRSKTQRIARRQAASHFDPAQPRDRNGRWIPTGVRDMLAEAKAGRTGGRAVVIGTVGDRFRGLAAKAGVTVRAKVIALDPSLTRHTILQHSTDPRIGQRGVTAGDLAAAATSMNAAKAVRVGRPSKQGVERFITLTTNRTDRTYAVFENRKGAATLVTMWVRKN